MTKNKFSVLFIIVLVGGLALSIALTAVVQAESSIPKPSVPEFYLKLVDYSYDVPSSTTTTTDPYTGQQTVTIQSGYHVDNKTIEVTIRNQPFTPYYIDNQHAIYLFFNVSYKGHYSGEWNYHPYRSFSRNSDAVRFLFPSTSEYTIVPFKAPTINAPTDGQMDFKVQAQIGYYNEHQEFYMAPGAPFTTYTFVGEVSGWSNTQTITIPTSNSTTSSASSSTSVTPIQIAEPAPALPTETPPQETETPAQAPEPAPSETTEPSPNQTTEPEENDTSQTLLLGIAIGTVMTLVLVSVGLLIYFRKRHREVTRV